MGLRGPGPGHRMACALRGFDSDIVRGDHGAQITTIRPSDGRLGQSQACEKIVAVQGNFGHGQIVQDRHEGLRRLLQFGR